MLHAKLLDADAKLPTDSASAYDLYANQRVTIPPGETRPVRTGVAVEFVPATGGMICSEPSLAKQSVIALGVVVEAGYRGEIVVLLHNLNRVAHAQIRKGTKVAQLAQLSATLGSVVQVRELSEAAQEEGK